MAETKQTRHLMSIDTCHSLTRELGEGEMSTR